MLLNEFSQNRFGPEDEKQWALIEGIKQYHSKHGTADRQEIMKALERTRPYTRTVYPHGWSRSEK